MKQILKACVAGSLSLTLVSCSRSDTNVELIQDMMESPAVKTQDYNPKRPGEMANMIPPEGTIPVGFTPYKYKGKADDAENFLVNPIAGKSLDRGKQLFETYCFVCHGAKGDGHGPVAAKFQVPVPSLLSDKVKKFKDGRIFHIITDGQGVMSAYATQVKKESDRWAIVNYVRSLQK